LLERASAGGAVGVFCSYPDCLNPNAHNSQHTQHSPPPSNTHSYEGGRTADAFASFLRGKVADDKGFARVASLDALAAKAGAAASGDLKKLVGEIEAAAKKLAGEEKADGEVYVKLAKKALDKVGIGEGGLGGGGVKGGTGDFVWCGRRGLGMKGHRVASLDLPCVTATLHTHTQHVHTHHNTHAPPHPPKKQKGVEYFKTEAARLERMIGSGGVAAAKLEEMTRKASVLAAFVGGEDAKDEE
jgi:hypothetical protein